MSRRILVTGATGKQGGAVVRALSSSTSPAYEIKALVRNSKSDASKALAALPNVTLIEGKYENINLIFKTLEAESIPLWGVFLVLSVGGDEVKWGKEFIELSKEAGVQHLVYSGVDKRGVENTSVEHYETKRAIEFSLQSSTLSHTILSPSIFYDNFTKLNTTEGKIGSTMMLTQLKSTKPLNMVSVSDLANFALLAFNNFEKEEWKNKEIILSGDLIKPEDLRNQFKEIKGKTIPTTFETPVKLFLKTVPDFGRMFKFLNETEPTQSVELCKNLNPSLKSWKEWVSTESDFNK